LLQAESRLVSVLRGGGFFDKMRVQVFSHGRDSRGKTVKVRRGPAAVNGDEIHHDHWLLTEGSGKGW